MTIRWLKLTRLPKDIYLLNEKGKKFHDVYADYGLDFRGFGFGAVFTDFDNDGDQDLIVNHDFGYKRTPNSCSKIDSPKNHLLIQ